MFRLALALAIILATLCVAHAYGQGIPPQESSSPVVQAETACVDLNTATVPELVQLPGIGPARANAIVEARGRRPFRRVEDILRVPGIGRKTFGRIRHRLCAE